MSHAIEEYNYGRMKLATATKEFCGPTKHLNTLFRKAAERSHSDCRGPVTFKTDKGLGFVNEKKLMEHILKVQRIGYGITLMELREQA
jgi:hypothetical protein